MTPSDCSTYRDEILSHFLDGAPLGGPAREHYLGCVECMREVTARLSDNVPELQQRGRGKVRVRGTADESPTLAEEGQRALAHGRKVLAREFGIG